MFDEFDIESYKLKPINKGLGFHEKEPGRLAVRSLSKTSLERRLEKENSMKGVDSLKAFYNTPTSGNKKLSGNNRTDVKEKGKIFLQFFGWLLDVVFICIISSATIVGLGLVAYMFGKTSLEMVILTFTRMNGMMGMVVLFAITYLLYFTYGDVDTSFGKKFFGVRLIAKSGKPPTSGMTLVRSMTTLCSLCFLGMPALFDFQGKLSSTKVVRL